MALCPVFIVQSKMYTKADHYCIHSLKHSLYFNLSILYIKYFMLTSWQYIINIFKTKILSNLGLKIHFGRYQYRLEVGVIRKSSWNNRAHKSRVYFEWRYEINGIIASFGTVIAQPHFRSHFKSMGDFSALQITAI